MLTVPTVQEYASHFKPYIDLVAGDLIDTLCSNADRIVELLLELPEEKWDYRYAADKWTIKEAIGHLIDNEIIMVYRLIRISRGDTTVLPGYDQEVLMVESPYPHFSPSNLIQYYKIVRQMTLTTLLGIPSEGWLRQGSISGNIVSARALAYIIAGHEIHHLNVLQDKYGVNGWRNEA